jgi:hypothetical protein
MPLQATSGAASYDAFGGGVPVVPQYIEEVFSTWLYDGNSSTQTITNNIDLSTKGGMVWLKRRTSVGGTAGHRLYDTNRGVAAYLQSNATAAESSYNPNLLSAFLTTGFTLGSDGSENGSGDSYVSWTFRKQPKFFDVVTYTGNGTATNNISHNLGSVPGFIVVKCTSAAGYRWVCAASDNSGNYLYLALNATFASDASTVKSNIANSTTFNPGYMGTYFDGGANVSGETYVAYLFAHNAGGFGLTGTDNVISCGSYTGNGSSTGPVVTLGYEPQWILLKQSSAAGNEWYLHDNMRGMPVGSADRFLNPNSSAAESSNENLTPLATGFQIATANGLANGSGETYIYIAIRRGPMKVPTDATKVFNTILRTGTGSTATVTGVGFTPDSLLFRPRDIGVPSIVDRLRGPAARLNTDRTDTEAVSNGTTQDVISFNTDGMTVGTEWNTQVNRSGSPIANWFFKRAPSFFDEVCYTGDSTNPRSVNHNLAVAPELLIVKGRSAASSWYVYSNFTSTTYKWANLNSASGFASRSYTDVDEGLSSQPTATVFNLDASGRTNGAGNTYVAYLFATCAGVSKVGTYTGTGTTKQIDCGFTAGARFVLIKKTSGTGSWYIWDTARGIVSGNDPYLLLNSTAAEVTSTDYIDAYSAGFEISSTAPSEINENGGSFIFLAIA